MTIPPLLPHLLFGGHQGRNLDRQFAGQELLEISFVVDAVIEHLRPGGDSGGRHQT